MEINDLKRLQEVQVEILGVVDKFCRENGIEYSLYAGTALGAVRHKGFIPWDDDTDICMERSHYERFIDLWKEKGIEGYYLQTTRPEEITTINHSKVRKNNTIFISGGREDVAKHQGIWLDVFAVDKVPRDKRKRRKMLLFSKIRLVYTRGYPYVGNGKVLELLSRIMLAVPKSLQKRIKNYSEKCIAKYKDMKSGYDLICFSCPAALNIVYPASVMEKFIDVPFSDKTVRITAEYDAMLKEHYGDYMRLPPEEERVCRHNPKKLVFDVNVETCEEAR